LIVAVGVSYRTAPLAVRESLAFPKERLTEALHRLRAEDAVTEGVILSTCNRVEVWAETTEPGGEGVVRFLAGFHRLDPASLEPHLFRLADEAAVRHVFEVAASLDSMVIGETQVLGQVQDACEAAEGAGTLGPVLGALRNHALATAKRVHTETGIGRNAVSVSHVAVELARKIFGHLTGRSVLLVGAGKMSAIAARQLVRGGARATVLGRDPERAQTVAAALGGRAASFESLRDEMAQADVVISGTGAPHLVIRREDVEAALRARGPRPLFLVDIASPRDVDPSARGLDGAFLYDLDDLKTVAEANLGLRARQAAAAQAVVDEELRAWRDRRRSREAVPMLVELRQRADTIRRTEVARAKERWGVWTAEQEQAVESVAAAIVNKLLHPPIVYLKDAARRGSGDELALAGHLLGLSGAPSRPERAAAEPAAAPLVPNFDAIGP